MRPLAAVVLALGARGADVGDFGMLRIEGSLRETDVAQGTVELLKQDMLAKGMPRVTFDLASEGYACYHMHRPLLAAKGGLDIEIQATPQKEFVAGSSAASVRFSTTHLTLNTSLRWRMDNTTTIGSEASVSVDFAGAAASVSMSGSHAGSRERKGDASLQTRVREDASMTIECPARTLCSFQAWTFVARLAGSCPEVPAVDPACFDRLARHVGDGGVFPARDALRRFMGANLTLPSVHGQVPAWDDLGMPYYSMARRDGSPAGKVLPAELRGGHWWPSDDDYAVRWAEEMPCNLAVPLYQPDGTPKRLLVLVERAMQSRARPVRWANGDGEPGMKVTVLARHLD